jgi:hypothetical protein
VATQLDCSAETLVATEPIQRAELGIECLVRARPEDVRWITESGYLEQDEILALGQLEAVDCDTGFFFCSVYGSDSCLTVEYETWSRGSDYLQYFDPTGGCGAPTEYSPDDFARRLEGAWRVGDVDWFTDRAGLFDYLEITFERTDPFTPGAACNAAGGATFVCEMLAPGLSPAEVSSVFIEIRADEETFEIIAFDHLFT